MNHAAKEVMASFTDITIAFGQSDEYSFVFRKGTNVFNRREDKILSCVLSLFTSSYALNFVDYFSDLMVPQEDGTLKQVTRPLRTPSFDGRIVLYPSLDDVKAYLSWRQVDTHINNLYNTTFWALVQNGGLSTTDAHKTLKGTFSKDKHSILFDQFGMNYNKEPEICKRGSILIRVFNKKRDKQDQKKNKNKGKGQQTQEAAQTAPP